MASFKTLFAAALLLPAGPALCDAGEGFDVLAYRLALTPDLSTRMLAGRETNRLRATANGLGVLRFSPNALTIDTATIDGARVSVRSGGGELALDLPKPLAAGKTATLELSYHGRPARGFAGTETLLYTSYFACDWMICAQDRFGDKAAFTLDLSVPDGMDTLSVGRRTAVRKAPDGRAIHRWTAPRPYPAYLFGFAIGHFQSVADRAGSARLVYLSDIADAAALRQRFAETGDMVRFMESRAGVALPAAPYGQLLVAGDEAQEAATYSVLGADSVPEHPGDPDADWAIAHELAHQWWGNLVTCATLDDFWLNEGIATFMTAAWKEHRHGRAAYDAEVDHARAAVEKARAKGFDKPLAWSGRYPTLGTRRAIQYSKGALFLDRLRATMGDAAFWKGLRLYTRAHAGGTATSRDFERAMEAAGGHDLHPLFAQWVYGPDAP